MKKGARRSVPADWQRSADGLSSEENGIEKKCHAATKPPDKTKPRTSDYSGLR
jgi:hypothetical protein